MPTDNETISQVNNVWGQNTAEGESVFLTTPSGQTCHAIRIGLQGMVKSGLLGDADSLTAFVDKKHIKRVRGGKGADRDELDPMSLMKDPDALGKVVMLVDRAMETVITEPVVLLHFVDNEDGTTTRIPIEDRDQTAIYTDQIGLDDKMFIFNWAVGGSADVERFRDESESAMAGVADGSGLSRAAKRASRNKRH